MIDDMHQRLNRWAEWVMSERTVKGLGYSACTIGRLTMPPSTFRMDPSIDTEASETDDVVKLLDEKAKRVIEVFYLGRGTQEQRASDLGCPRKTMVDRVHAAQGRLVEIIKERRKTRVWPAKSIFTRGG